MKISLFCCKSRVRRSVIPICAIYELTDKNNPLYNRTRGMSVENLVALACVYQVSLDYLLGYSDAREPLVESKMESVC